jgi:hypothetical protein
MGSPAFTIRNETLMALVTGSGNTGALVVVFSDTFAVKPEAARHVLAAEVVEPEARSLCTATKSARSGDEKCAVRFAAAGMIDPS